ncbi:Ribonuclease Z, partial [Dysosmobacter welbionis]
PLPPGAFQQVLAGVGRHPQDVGPLVLRALKLPGLHQQLHEDRLADILGIVGVFQIGVTEAEDRVGVCVGQPLRLFHIVHVSQLLWSALTQDTIRRGKNFQGGESFFQGRKKRPLGPLGSGFILPRLKQSAPRVPCP